MKSNEDKPYAATSYNLDNTAFISNTSHNMRTALNTILGFTNLALGTDDIIQIHDCLRKIKFSGNQLLSLINDTIELRKIASNDIVYRKSPLNLAFFLEKIAEPFQNAADAKKIQFNVKLQNFEDPWLLGDKSSLQKIFNNLISNAIKFTPESGSITLSAQYMPEAEDGCNVKFSVQDSGIGIAPNILPTIFEPFSQVQKSQNSPGTGLGLAIVKQLTTSLGGHVQACNAPEGGTIFSVFLPLPKGEKTSVEIIKSVENKICLNGKTVLLCEDNLLNREIAMVLLEQMGLHVFCAVNGKEGVKTFAASPEDTFNIILMDLRMPVMDGYEAAAQIRAMSRRDAKTVPIIALTADAYAAEDAKNADGNITGHIAKPVEPSTLYRELTRVCR